MQGLVAAEMALDLGQVEYARSLIAGTSSQARNWIGELAGDQELEPGMAVRSAPARTAGGATDRRTSSVLIVDDSEDLRELLSLVIARIPTAGAWWRPRPRASRRSRRPGSSQPDLVLLDIAMPVMDGMQALPHIRQAAPDAVVVMLSGYPFSTAGQGALNAGAHGYLEKSDLVKGLIPRLERIIESASPTDDA